MASHHIHMDLAYQFMDATTPLARWQWLLLLVPCAALLLLLLASRRRARSNDVRPGRRQLPPSLPALPIIGHLLLVGDSPHVSFRDLAAEHDRGSGLMLLRLGSVPNLVVSSARAAQAILRTHDHVFASRPASSLFDDLVYGSSDVGFAPYGEHWRQVRKLVTTHLLNVKKVNSYHHARQEEVLFRGTHWLRQWARLQRQDEQREQLMLAGQHLELSALQFFSANGWLSTRHIGHV